MLAPLTGDAAPVADCELEPLFSSLGDFRHVLLAVSGGPDSMALMGLAARWATMSGAKPALSVATVDHGLRAGSDRDARAVERCATEMGLPCAVLAWAGSKPETGVQEAAREARRRLLAARARASGAQAIVTAHTLDDQAETVLMRLAAGSGIAGLGGMRSRSAWEGMPFLRPFLDLPKARLIATCLHHGWPSVTDPANGDPRFARARLRAARDVLTQEGLTVERLAALARRAGQTADAIDWAAARLFPGAAEAERLILRQIAEAPPAIGLAVFGRWITRLAGVEPKLERMERCFAHLAAAARGGEAARRTLAGLVLSLSPEGVLTGSPERRRRGVVNLAGQSRLGKGRGQP